ncbi:hypothetical protein B0H16DRAFT_1476271 [Mycena metata]|uniref:Uncharacterized protein n=1 Tax=Mycena metata TaxID=1033252 RepID=A0AAD7HBR5_9AGAR|nr:hypothetical protein B0H16DRAFT_1476271 [Mycena metata]
MHTDTKNRWAFFSNGSRARVHSLTNEGDDNGREREEQGRVRRTPAQTLSGSRGSTRRELVGAGRKPPTSSPSLSSSSSTPPVAVVYAAVPATSAMMQHGTILAPPQVRCANNSDSVWAAVGMCTGSLLHRYPRIMCIYSQFTTFHPYLAASFLKFLIRFLYLHS